MRDKCNFKIEEKVIYMVKSTASRGHNRFWNPGQVACHSVIMCAKRVMIYLNNGLN